MHGHVALDAPARSDYVECKETFKCPPLGLMHLSSSGMSSMGSLQGRPSHPHAPTGSLGAPGGPDMIPKVYIEGSMDAEEVTYHQQACQQQGDPADVS